MTTGFSILSSAPPESDQLESNRYPSEVHVLNPCPIVYYLKDGREYFFELFHL